MSENLREVLDDAGNLLCRVYIQEGKNLEDVLNALSAPKVEKKKVSSKILYNTLEKVYPSDDNKRIYFKFANQKQVPYWDLPGKKMYHDEGTPFLKSHYDKLRVLWSNVIRQSENLWVKYFLMNVGALAESIASGHITKMGTYLYTTIAAEETYVLERIAKAGLYVQLRTRWNTYNAPYIQGETIESILGVDRRFTSMYRNKEFKLRTLSNYKKIMDSRTEQIYQYAFEEYREEFASDDTEIIKHLVEIGYNWKRLVDYIMSDLQYQGLPYTSNLGSNYYSRNNDGITLLRDYVQMCTDMGIDYERYPKHLFSAHKIAEYNYKTKKDEILDRRIKEQTAKKQYLEFGQENDVYKIVLPTKVDDLVTEGANLGHCVASYTQRVANGSTNIVFLRSRDNPDQSLCTIEVRDFKLIQAKAERNSRPSGPQQAFIDKYVNYLEACSEKENINATG